MRLLITLGIAVFSQRVRKACTWGVAISSVYLVMAAGAKLMVKQRITPTLAQQGLDETRLIDDKETLIATDIRLGFPGFHPFSFTLATLENGHWKPIAVSEQMQNTRELQMETLSRLAARAASNTSALCASDFVAQKWRVEHFLYRC